MGYWLVRTLAFKTAALVSLAVSVRAVASQIAALVVLLAGVSSAQAQSEKIYVFGNSLINHASDTEKTAVPYWLGYLAEKRGQSFELDGQSGFLRNLPKELPPRANWGFSTVNSAWPRTIRAFEDVGYDTIVFNPTNFIQYQAADLPYESDNPNEETPLSVTVTLLKAVAEGKRVITYEGWADMAPFLRSFPPNNRRLRKYHTFNSEDFHDWHVDYVAAIKKELPDMRVDLVPVARILARAFLETGLKDIPVEALYSDDAPHGTPSLYFLASIPTYHALFEDLPMAADVPSDVHPLIAENFDAFAKIVRSEMPHLQAWVPQQSETRQSENAAQTTASIDERGSTPALGYGLNGIADWSTQMPFVDIFKTARQWVGHLPGQFGGWEEADLREGGHLDAYGWPMRIPAELTKIETFMMTDFPEDAAQHAGIYRLTYEGTGKVDIGGRARALRYGEKEIWFRFSPGDGLLGVSISETDPEGTGDYVHNISVVREDQIPLFETGAPFNPEWLAAVKNVRLLRFMDWMSTNGSEKRTWADRAQIDDYSYTHRGVPMEVMVELSNHIGADPWFNMPHMADDDYVAQFAGYVASDLASGLVAHVEYSNEVWNFLFPQTHWAVEQAETLWGENPDGDAWMQFYGVRSAEVAKIWSDAFASDMTRLKRIMATHTDWPGLEHGVLEAPLATKRGGGRPAEMFDAYAVTGYFGHEYGSDEKAQEVLGWIEESQAAGQGYQKAIGRITKDIRAHSLKELTQTSWPYHADITQKYDLDLMMYEGGTHLVGVGDWTGNEELTEFFLALNYSPEMAQIYNTLLDGWNAVGGQVFNAFVDVAQPTRWGSWGTRRHLMDRNPRLDALEAYNAAGASWSDTRQASDFASGVASFGTEQDDLAEGSDRSDILLGGDGNDEFLPQGGIDYLHGGAGDDHVVLKGFLEEYQFSSQTGRIIAVSPHGKANLYGIETLGFSQMPDVIIPTSNLF
ncbi:calcium-binding protein [Cognatishimia sp.]|uniref:calcium-binding protein n=1 Tax=Cognatishimia sp. TaxID=2211648 RepID=UPI003BAADE0D